MSTHRPAWFPDWTGQPCAIVAGGPSVTPEAVAALQGRCRVAVVNNAHELAPWADVLYAADGCWWGHYGAARVFRALKVTCDLGAAKVHRLHRVEVAEGERPDAHEIKLAEPGRIGHGGNSGFQALNLALQFGARDIALLGFDMKGAEHWHGKHPEPPLRNPREHKVAIWRERLDGQASRLRALGVRVTVCGDSALRAYPRSTVEALLERWERGCAA